MRIKHVKFRWMADISTDFDSESGDVDVIVHMMDAHGNRRCGQIMFNANELMDAPEGYDLCAFRIVSGMPPKSLELVWFCEECKRYYPVWDQSHVHEDGQP